MAYDRAVQETRHALKYPDAAEWPSPEEVTVKDNGDTITVMFSVLAPNAFGVKSSALTIMSFTVDSCAHLAGGTAAGVGLYPDPPGAPCDFYKIMDLRRAEEERLFNMPKEERWAYEDSIKAVMLGR